MSPAPNPERMTRYPLTWPAWLAEKVAEASSARAMSMATWIREAALEKLERTAPPAPRDRTEDRSGTGPRYPWVTVEQPEDMSTRSAIPALVSRVRSALVRAGADAEQVRLFEDSAAEFTSYGNVLVVARYWVTVTP